MEGKQTLQNEILSVKVKFNEDIRRLSCPINTTFDALRTEVLEKYGLDTNTKLCLKYEDEEGDLITLGSEADLKEALQIVPATKLLRLNLVKGKQVHKQGPVEAVAITPQSPMIPAVTTVQSSGTGVPGNVISKDELKRFKKEIKHHHKDHKDHKDHDDKAHAKSAKHAMKAEFKKQKEAAKAATKGAKNVARFVKDVATPDETEVAPGTPFVKTWRFRNEGTSAWPENCQLVFVSKLNGDQMGAPAYVPVPSAHVGQELDVSVPMVAPTAPGRYVGYWRLCSGDGKKFGQRVRVLIQVAASSSSDSASTSSSSEDEHAEMASALHQLEQLGFTDKELNTKVLKKHSGNVESAMACIVKKQERKAEKAKKKAEKAAAKEAAKKQKKASKSATNTPRK